MWISENATLVYQLNVRIAWERNLLKRLSFVLIAILLALIGFDFAVPVFANKPEIRDVAVSKIGNRYNLNITICHTVESSTHYVDTVRVNIGSENITDLTMGPHSLSQDYTFNILYDLGVLPHDPVGVGVWVRCTQDGWCNVPWSGNVPEFSLPILLIGFVLVTSLAVFAFRRAKLVSDG